MCGVQERERAERGYCVLPSAFFINSPRYLSLVTGRPHLPQGGCALSATHTDTSFHSSILPSCCRCCPYIRPPVLYRDSKLMSPSSGLESNSFNIFENIPQAKSMGADKEKERGYSGSRFFLLFFPIRMLYTLEIKLLNKGEGASQLIRLATHYPPRSRAPVKTAAPDHRTRTDC